MLNGNIQLPVLTENLVTMHRGLQHEYDSLPVRTPSKVLYPPQCSEELERFFQSAVSYTIIDYF